MLLAPRLDDFGHPCAACQPPVHERHHLAIGPATRALVLVDDHVIKAVADDLGLANDVHVAPISGRGVHHQPPIVRHATNGIDKRHQGVGVVPVVDHDGGLFILKHVEPPRRAAGVAGEGGQRHAHHFARNAH